MSKGNSADTLQVPDLVARRLDHLGERGKVWLAELPQRVAQLAQRWQFSVGEVLHGGSEALVVEVQRTGKPPAVLKLLVPQEQIDEANDAPLSREAEVLAAAKGHGYAQLYAATEDGQAMLLERLGAPLAAVHDDVALQQHKLCVALRRSWQVSDVPQGLLTGAEKARWLRHFIQDLAAKHPEALHADTLALAERFTEEREAAHEEAHKVLVHGDPHEYNALRNSADGFSFVDPDGLYAEPEYDVGVIMREASEELLIAAYERAVVGEWRLAAPLPRGIERCRRLAGLTATDPKAVWQWGYIERVSTGLYTLELGMPEYSQPALLVANSWALQGAGEVFDTIHTEPELPLLEVRNSSIHGKGLFAGEPISEGAVIGWCEVEPADPPGPYTLWSESGPVNVLCDLRFTNHSTNPNVVYYDSLRVVALRDIEAGEELTYNYGEIDF